MIVALDTNVWLKERLLRSPTGVALLYAVRRLNSRILLPDSTRREIVAGVERDGAGAVRSIERGLRIVQELVGARPSITTPTPEQFREGAERRLEELGDLIQLVELTPGYLEAAMDRVIAHRAPARTSEQFRDCVLWECLMDQEGECMLVTEDGDFLDKSAKRVALAPELEEESGGRVQVYSSAADLLRAIEPQLPQVNTDRIADAIAAGIERELENAAASQAWRLGSRTDGSVELYATENPNTITVVFKVDFQAFDGTDLEGLPVEEGIVRAVGESLFSDQHGVSDLRLDSIELFTPSGSRMRGGVAYINAATAYIGGRPDVPYRVRTPLPGAPA